MTCPYVESPELQASSSDHSFHFVFWIEYPVPLLSTFPNAIHPGKLSQRVIMCLGNSELFRCEDTFSKVHRVVICPVGFPVPSSLQSNLIKSHIIIMENDKTTA